MILRCEPRTKDAYRLFHEGTIMLARAERTGLRVDMDYYRNVTIEINGRVAKLEAALLTTTLGKTWKRVVPGTPEWGNGAALSKVLDAMKITTKETARGRRGVSEEALRDCSVQGMEQLIEWRKLTKLTGTYIAQITREECDGVIHPFFSLATGAADDDTGGAQTFRGSCSNPNFQNLPIRNPESGAYIRKGIFPRRGHQFMENDYKGIEVKIGFFYHQDPTMYKYLTDNSTDMHRDCAMDCFRLGISQVSKHVRYLGKNGFVFPEFYGSYWAQVAPALWSGAKSATLNDGTPLMDHLMREFSGFSEFEQHIREVEHKLWYTRFPVFRKWREQWWAAYQKNGYFDTFTGFRIWGTVLSKNQSLNYPIQGPAFHCLLWSLIQLDKWIRDNNADSRIVGQIHDAALQDMAPGELDEYLNEACIIMRDRIREQWDWITLPLDIETDVAPVDGSWYEKSSYNERV